MTTKDGCQVSILISAIMYKQPLLKEISADLIYTQDGDEEG